MFGDQGSQEEAKLKATLEIIKERKGEWVLKKDNRILTKYTHINGLANRLMDAVIFLLISSNNSGIAIHAGLVSDRGGSILLPANSGSGKSLITSWLINKKMYYHTDELVLINIENFSLKAFTRPIKIKTNGMDALSEIIDVNEIRDRLISTPIATYIPHRLINSEFIQEIPPLKLIIFPKYEVDSGPKLSIVSAAEAGLEMMRSNVIARNQPDHGFNNIIKLVRGVQAYRLNYNQFDDLDNILKHLI